MRTQRLAFSQLHEELEVLEQNTLRSLKGGDDGDPIWEFGMNGYGQQFIRLYGSTEWIPMFEEVVIPYIDNTPPAAFDYNNYTFIGENPFGFPSGGGSGTGGTGGSNTPWPRIFQDGITNLDAFSNISGILAYAANNPSLAGAFSHLGNLAAVGSFALDLKSMSDFYRNGQGNMDGIRFSIRQGGAAGVLIEASIVGGPQGLIVGVAGAGAIIGFEYTYDAFQVWMAHVAQGLTEYENALANGYNPAIH